MGVKLSQCMIVKNEERNIEQALGWAKDIAFEQIVVDTGSVDRTVELAEKMGAKVYHFNWIDDFSAAKNFAIEQASGNWIAFLDADEYVEKSDIPELMALLGKIQSDSKLRKKYSAVNTPWVQLDNDNKVFSVLTQERFFRNHPTVRYIGRIHEHISVGIDGIMCVDGPKIFHTGYSPSEYDESGKAQRNVYLLRKELEVNPNDSNIKGYLADSLIACKDDALIPEAEALYMEIINAGTNITPARKKRGYTHFLCKYYGIPDKINDYKEINDKAIVDFPDDMDIQSHYAASLNMSGQFNKALEVLRVCEVKLSDTDMGKTNNDAINAAFVFSQMILATQGIGDVDGLLKYAAALLTMDKTNSGILKSFISVLLKQNLPENKIIDVLATIYDFKNPNDLLLIARTAKDIGAVDLAGCIVRMAGEIIGS